MSDYSALVWRILSAIPIEIVDNHVVLHSETWELVTPRTEGDYIGSRVIGTANIVSAYNLLHLKMMADPATRDSDYLAEYKAVLEQLATQKLIRKLPSKVREQFRAV